jgi:hypothetical protein
MSVTFVVVQVFLTETAIVTETSSMSVVYVVVQVFQRETVTVTAIL